MQSHKDITQVEKACILVMDIGGSFIKSGIFSFNGNLLENPPQAIDSGGSKMCILTSIVQIIRNTITTFPSIMGIGISIPGPFEYTKGICLMKHKFKSFYNEDLKLSLIQLVPEIGKMTICFCHDANAFLLGEVIYGAAKDYDRVGGITLGTGIGAAFYDNKQLLCNEFGSPADDVPIWNLSYDGNIAEEHFSSRAIISHYINYRNEYNPENGVKGIAEAAKLHDLVAVHIFDQFGRKLGHFLQGWCRRWHPKIIIVGGQIARSFELFEQPLQQALVNFDVIVRKSELDTHAALYGAAEMLLSNTFDVGDNTCQKINWRTW